MSGSIFGPEIPDEPPADWPCDDCDKTYGEHDDADHEFVAAPPSDEGGE